MSSTVEKPPIARRNVSGTKILRKCGESVEMKEKFFSTIRGCKSRRWRKDMAKRFAQGKKLLVMGNGGSLCDALHLRRVHTPDYREARRVSRDPPHDRHRDHDRDWQRPDFSRVFVNQLRLLGQPGDMRWRSARAANRPT